MQGCNLDTDIGSDVPATPGGILLALSTGFVRGKRIAYAHGAFGLDYGTVYDRHLTSQEPDYGDYFSKLRCNYKDGGALDC